MAELDLLRHVEVLSTVSGGSVTGALYALLLRREINLHGNLTQQAYLAIVEELRHLVASGIQKNLRTRLFWNPLTNLRTLLTNYGLARHMSRLYDRHFFRRVTTQPMRLRELRSTPQGQPVTDLEGYNSTHSTKIPSLILNATSLNVGAPFRFTSVEIGDRVLGHFRFDEIEPELLPRKYLLERVSDTDLAAASRTGGSPLSYKRKPIPAATTRYAAWWRVYQAQPQTPSAWSHHLPQTVRQLGSLYGHLARAELGLLRKAKLAAWYYVRGPQRQPPVPGSYTPAEYEAEFWAALQTVDAQTAHLRKSYSTPAMLGELMEFVLHVYYLRSAEALGWGALDDFARLTLADAVGASACFPPVFPPFRVLGVYDDGLVGLLGLTDGGVYDNMGITSLLMEGCTHIIASDTGGVFDIQPAISSGRLGMMGRITGILMKDVGEEQRSALRERREVTRAIDGAQGKNLPSIAGTYHLKGLAYFHINSPNIDNASLLPPLMDPDRLRYLLSRLRTDLDGFGEIEIAVLVNHGHETADTYLRQYLDPKDFGLAPWTSASTRPMPITARPEQLERILLVGHYRLFRALRLGALEPWIGVVLVAAALALDASQGWAGSQTLLRWLSTGVSLWLPTTLGTLRRAWAAVPLPLRSLLVAAGILGPCIAMLLAARVNLTIGGSRRASRAFGTFLKCARPAAGNLLWLPGPAPVTLAFLISLGAWISYVVHGLPFLRKTRQSEVKPRD